MPTLAPSPLPSSLVERHRFTVDEYHRMGAAGIFDEDDRVELLGGEIIEMTPIGLRHAYCVNMLTRLFSARAQDRFLVQVQNPLRLGPHDEPQPDLALLRPPFDAYATRMPTGADALLVVEAADTSLARDRDVKGPRYAAAGVPELWIVDLTARAVHALRSPRSDGYGDLCEMDPEGRLAPAFLPDIEIAVADLLPPL